MAQAGRRNVAPVVRASPAVRDAAGRVSGNSTAAATKSTAPKALIARKIPCHEVNRRIWAPISGATSGAVP